MYIFVASDIPQVGEIGAVHSLQTRTNQLPITKQRTRSTPINIAELEHYVNLKREDIESQYEVSRVFSLLLLLFVCLLTSLLIVISIHSRNWFNGFQLIFMSRHFPKIIRTRALLLKGTTIN